jgi:hypothetical protein
VLCLWSDQCEFMALFVVFNVWFGPGYILSLVNSHFPVISHGLDLFSGMYLNKLLFL